jgi:hypothetical protein
MVDILMDKVAEREARAAEIETPDVGYRGGLDGIVWQQWTINMRHRQNEIDDVLEDCHNMRAAKYSDSKAAQIRATGGEEVYAPLAAMQSISGSASVSQVVLPSSERAWSLKPTPIPDLPGEIQDLIRAQIDAESQTTSPGARFTGRREELEKAQRARIDAEAKRAAHHMERKIDDQLVDSGFYDTMVQFIEDFATYPYAVTKRITVHEPVLEWVNGKPKRKMRTKDLDVRVSPFDIYPSPGMVTVHDGPLIERLRLRPYELSKHREVPGFNKEAIDRVLMAPSGNWLFAWNDSDRNATEDNELLNTESESDLIDVLRYWGMLKGCDLKEYGIDVDDENEFYDTEVWLCGHEVLRVAKNPHPLDRRPYYKAIWRSIPGQFWGTSPPAQTKHLQDICNAAMRALVKNMGISAGPQVVIMIDQLPKGEESITSIYPLKVWQMVSKPGQSQAPIQFFQPQSNAKELIGVFQHYWELAGDVTGIYRWNYGADQGMQGAAQTMNGLSMLLENSNKVIRHAVANLEQGVIIPRIHDQFLINMLYDPDERIKGDIDVVARGSSSLIERSGIRQRRIELLTAINNTPESQIPGMDLLMQKARMAILTETAKDLDIESNKFPTDEEIEEILVQFAELRKNQQQPKDPRVEAAEIAYKSRIEDQKLEMEDREKQRSHQKEVEQMRLSGLQMQMEKSGQLTFEKDKANMTKDLLKMQQNEQHFNKEIAVKQQKGTGI